MTETTTAQKLVFEPPNEETPGYLRRQKQAIEFFAKMQALGTDLSPDVLNDMVDFLLPWVRVPEDRDEACTMLWELSKKEFWDLIYAAQGGAEKNSPPTPNTESS